MTKTRLVWFLTIFAALVAVAVILFMTSQNDLSVNSAKVEQLPEGQDILVNAWPETQSVQKGDAFLYTIEALYDPDEISEVDRESLDDNVDLDPFEIRGFTEVEFNLDSGLRVYQRQYEIQLISGDTESLYEFPTIVVRYKLKDNAGSADASIVPESVYVASRLSEDISSIVSDLALGNDPLLGLEGEIEDADQNRLPWIFWSVGGLLLILTVADLTMRVIPQWKEGERQARKAKASDIVFQAYRSLKGNVAKGDSPQSIFHQMGHILRVILAQKENAGWLEEPDLNTVSNEIKPTVISLSEKCQEAYGAEEIKQEEVEEATGQLEEILKFYFAGEMEVWKK